MEPVATDNETVDARIDWKKVLAIKQKKESPKNTAFMGQQNPVDYFTEYVS